MVSDSKHKNEKLGQARPARLRAVASATTGLALFAGTLGVAGLTGAPGQVTRARVTSSTAQSELDRTISDNSIRESSGLARSSYHRRVLWTHNDSGGGPFVYALGGRGVTKATYELKGARIRDWEDMATGPDNSLWIGDIGDNASARPTISVFRVNEPEALTGGSLDFTKYDFRYEDGPHDAESLLIKPRSGRVYVASKTRDGAALYRAPKELSTSTVNVLTRVPGAGVPILATGGSFFRDRKSYVLRNHNWAYVYRGFGDAPTAIRLPEERQGESIEVNRRGAALFTGSEGLSSPIHKTMLAATAPTTQRLEPAAASTGRVVDWKAERPSVPGNGVIRPEQFGAVGDGVHDDNRALQRALDRAASKGAKVELSAGKTYLSTRRLDMPSGTYLFGHGSRSRLRFTWEVNDDANDGYYLGNSDQLNGNTDITLLNFKIRGAGSGVPSGPKAMQEVPRIPAVRLRLLTRFKVKGVEIARAPAISLIFQGSQHGRIKGNYFHNSGRDGINSTWHKRNMHHVVIANNRIEEVGDDGIAVIGVPGQTPNDSELPYDVLVRNNKILGWGDDPSGLQLGRGIAVLAATRVTLLDNVVKRTDSYGILVTGSTRGNMSIDPATGQPWRSEDISVDSNRITDPGAHGIIVKRSDRVSLHQNEISGARQNVALYDCRDCGRG